MFVLINAFQTNILFSPKAPHFDGAIRSSLATQSALSSACNGWRGYWPCQSECRHSMRCMYVSLPWQRVASTMVALKGEGKRDAPRTITACQHASRAEPMQAACIPPWLMPDAELINAHHVRASGMRFASSLCRAKAYTRCVTRHMAWWTSIWWFYSQAQPGVIYWLTSFRIVCHCNTQQKFHKTLMQCGILIQNSCFLTHKINRSALYWWRSKENWHRGSVSLCAPLQTAW